jgi:thioredoxin reductase (NADPH)
MTAERLDLVIVGAGPAGLSAAYAAQKNGLRYVVLERALLAQTIREFPLRQPLHSPAHDVELLWGELLTPENPTREEVLAHYRGFARRHGLSVRCHEPVHQLERVGAGFRLRSERADYQAAKVLIATGGFGRPRRLGAVGETAERVSYRFVEAGPYAGRDVLVVGGGNSAAEAALALQAAGARVTLSVRRPSFAPRDGTPDAFTSIKKFNSRPLEDLAAEGKLTLLFSSQVTGLFDGEAELRVDGEEAPRRITCRHVFALLGADPDVTLLRQAGAEIAADGRPVYHPSSYETTVPGLYVAGHLTRELHMTNAIALAPLIVAHAAAGLALARRDGRLAAALAGWVRALRRRHRVMAGLRAFPRLRERVQALAAAYASLAKREARVTFAIW